MNAVLRWVKAHKIITGVVVFVVLITLLGLLGGDPDDDRSENEATDPETTSTEASTSAEPSPEDSTSTADPTPAPTPVARAASCTDGEGDGGALDLTRVQLEESDYALVVTYSLTLAEMPSAGTWLLSTSVWGEDGETGYQLGVKYVDGVPSETFVFDFNEFTQKNLDSGAATVDGGTVVASFPLDDLSGLGEEFTWSAIANVDGADVDRCPEAGDDAINPESLPFPG